MADDGDIRIGTEERDEALAALAVHRDAGRLDAFEYEDRRGKAVDAVTKRDLTALFTDLPEPRPKLAGTRSSAGAGVAQRPAGPVAARRHRKVGQTIASLSPFIALAAFAVTRSWLAFLLIPVLAIIGNAIDD
ncbi:hypothetical protein GCM10027053_05310 [Intrasporangium mesophilum]